ncbi:MAG: hypothetical protein M3O35_04090 [Acidobacteriota bacterium]|nr:hypothetical protein [Acidobacteriota bacterium]
MTRKTKAGGAKQTPNSGSALGKPHEQGMSEAADCLEPPDAIDVVEGCVGETGLDLETKLKDLFPSQEKRGQFCQCVADSSGVNRGKIPCGGDTTLKDVVDAISC